MLVVLHFSGSDMSSERVGGMPASVGVTPRQSYDPRQKVGFDYLPLTEFGLEEVGSRFKLHCFRCYLALPACTLCIIGFQFDLLNLEPVFQEMVRNECARVGSKQAETSFSHCSRCEDLIASGFTAEQERYG